MDIWGKAFQAMTKRSAKVLRQNAITAVTISRLLRLGDHPAESSVTTGSLLKGRQEIQGTEGKVKISGSKRVQ